MTAAPSTGLVGRINPAAEPGTRSISVFVTLPNADLALKGGMFAAGKVVIAGTAPVNALPAQAVREEGGQSFVYTLKDGQLDRTTGPQAGQPGPQEQ